MKRYKIAGLIVEMNLRYNRLKNQAEPYLYEGSAQTDISLNIEDGVMEKARKQYPNIDDDGLEYLLYGFLFYDKLLDFDGMMLHASAVGVGQNAYLFSANSGVGKSTHTNYWTQLINGAHIINDDKPALRIINEKIYVCGTPFSGKHDISTNKIYKLGGICFLERGEKNVIDGISPEEALPLILPQTASKHSKERVSKKLELIDKILTGTKLYKMKCTNHIDAASCAFEKMKVSVPVYLEEMLDVMEETLKAGGNVTFVTKGASMVPLLVSKRDSVVLTKGDSYKKGDVVLFRNEKGDFVLHRIVKLKDGKIYTMGDSLLTEDTPIKEQNIIAKATAFIINGKKINVTDFSYKMYRLVYMSAFGRALRLFKRKWQYR